MNPIFLSKTTAGASTTLVESNGKFGTFIAAGVWNGATITMQVSPDGGTTWVNTGVLLTADGVANFITGRGVRYRLNLTAPGASTSLSAWITFET